MKQNESIKKIMSTELITATPLTKFSDVKKMMEAGAIHHVPVVEGKKIVGILSRTDILNASFSNVLTYNQAEAEQMLDHSVKIADIMTKNPITLKDSDTVKHAVELLTRNSFNSLPVVDSDAQLVGILTTKDMLYYLLDQY